VIVGVGTDLVDIDRFAAALDRRPRLAQRCFTRAEESYCASRAFPPQHFAARFAAKEAVGKALGVGMRRWQEVEVVRGPLGAPGIALHGRFAQRGLELRIARVHISLTHDRGTAMAFAVAESDAEAADLRA
jgi:holo-[acyl-carrier protein] synthase